MKSNNDVLFIFKNSMHLIFNIYYNNQRKLFIEIHRAWNRSIFRKVRNFCFSFVRIVYCTIVFQGRCTKAFGGFVPTREKIARYLHIHTMSRWFCASTHADRTPRVHWIIDENVLVIYAIKVCEKKMWFRFFLPPKYFDLMVYLSSICFGKEDI